LVEGFETGLAVDIGTFLDWLAGLFGPLPELLLAYCAFELLAALALVFFKPFRLLSWDSVSFF